MSRRCVLAALLFVSSTALAVRPAAAVIKLEITVAKNFELSKAVLLGKIAAVQTDSRVINVDAIQAAKGTAPGLQLRIVLASPPELIKEVAAGQPVVLFVSKAPGAGMAVIHLADTWLLANGLPGSNGLVWRVVQVHDATKPSFPGRTVTLVRLIDELKAGRNPLLDKFERKLFPSGLRPRAKLSIQKPLWIMAAAVNGDKQPDLVVGTASGVRLLLAKDRDYQDATEVWGLAGAAAGAHAAGDINGDGKTDLLLQNTIWTNDGRKFTASKPPLDLPGTVRPLAAAFLDLTGDGKPDATVLAVHGELRVFENAGAPDRPWPPRPTKTLDKIPAAPVMAAFGDWGDDGQPHVLVVGESGIVRYSLAADRAAPADLERLTGVNLSKNPKYRAGLKNVQAVAFAADNNGRPDVLAICDGGGLLLLNRGFGTCLLDEDAAGPFAARDNYRPPFRLSAATPWATADLDADGLDDLLVLTEDGTLYEALNAK